MKPFTIEQIPFSEAAGFVWRTHRTLPLSPIRVQIRRCLAVYWKHRIRAVAMLGEPVAPSLCRTHLEVRRLASDGLYGACSALYVACRDAALPRRLVTYTLPGESGASLRAAGMVEDGLTRGTRDTRKGRTGAAQGVKVRWVFPMANRSGLDA
jgi:hypothetical protein